MVSKTANILGRNCVDFDDDDDGDDGDDGDDYDNDLYVLW